MSTRTLPPPSASVGSAGRGTRPPRTAKGSGTPGPVRVCRPPKDPLPFTVPHFRAWAAELLLDTEQPFRPEHFQEAFLRDVFSGVREAWLIVPEGNGKTTLMAALALYHCEYRPHAAVSIAAASREQAEIMYRQAEGFVLRTPRLHEFVHSALQAAKGKKKLDVPRFVCLEGYRRVNHFGGGRIQVFAADDRTGDGIIPTFGLIDEPHRQRDLSLYRTWAGKLEKRDGQIVAISTAGEPGSDFETTREQIRKSAESVTVKGSFARSASAGMVLHEWAIASDARPDDFRAVKRANPFSGITIPKLRAKYARPTMTMQHWLRFVCNRPTRSISAAIEEAEWRSAGTPPVEIPAGVPIWLGLDVAWKWDTTSAVPLWWRDVHFRVLGPASILVPPRDGTSLDPGAVEKALLEIHARNPVHTVVMDMSRAEQLAQWIGDTLGATVVDRPQSNVFAAEDYERFMEALRSGWLKHSGDAGLTAHILNAITRVLPAGNARFDRPAEARVSDQQERRVIDALSAASMVHAVAAQPAEVVPEPAILGLLRGITGPLPDRPPESVSVVPTFRRLLGSHEVAAP